jgi:tetratricopeptide (TPR) repeat protein
MIAALLGLLLFADPTSSLILLARGDQEFAAMHYVLAEAIYDSALTTSSDPADAFWRLARVSVCMADVSPEEEKLDLYRKAEVFASRCIQEDSMKSEGRTWRAAALGNIAMFEGGRVKIDLCHLIRKELELSIALNPSNDSAYSILGSFYMALGNVSWIERRLAALFLASLPHGGYEESEDAFKTAIALAPHVIRHHYELGDLYMQQDRYPEALKEFRQVMTLPELLASDRRTRQSAAGRIAELSGE